MLVGIVRPVRRGVVVDVASWFNSDDMNSDLRELGIPFDADVPLGPLTWFGVGGCAMVLAHPMDVEQLSALAEYCHDRHMPMRVLGSGANLLVADEGVDGVVVKLDAPNFNQKHININKVTVGAGYSLFKLVPETARAGLAGLEVLAGIPASVGGAVRMNAGGTYGDIGQVVSRVRTMDLAGKISDHHDVIFGYRSTNIAEPFILEVEFDLSREEAQELTRRYKHIFDQKKASQPFEENAAGCTFKNPPAEDGRKAGELIDKAGLKGFQIGGARVSGQHANFIAACDKNCTAADILAVIDHVQHTVHQRHGIMLQREVVLWP